MDGPSWNCVEGFRGLYSPTSPADHWFTIKCADVTLWAMCTDDPIYVDGQYYLEGQHAAQPYYRRSDVWYAIWWNPGTSKWTISTEEGVLGDRYWDRSGSMLGRYDPHATATMDVNLVLDSQAMLDATGSPGPDCSGPYTRDEDFGTKSCFARMAGGFYLFWSPLSTCWCIATAKTDPVGANGWASGTLEGVYSPFGTYDNDVTVAFHVP